MSSIATSTSPLSPLQVAARLLAVDAATLAAYLESQGNATAGESIYAAQTASDVGRALRQPRADRSFRDTFRTR
ncbi:MAG: hypothetical protein H0W83_04805 [Planctomycetes bacterium]|nr:hypothetical protein [Planctomycetota bacterium]